MSTPVNEAKSCPSCGQPMPQGVLAGLCPACLLAQGVQTEAGDGEGPGRFTPPSIETLQKLFPQLEILSLVGAGGMGAVYKARQPALDRWVALKILPGPGAGGTAFAERFNREARALARLTHPNIVAVHEFGQVEGLPYFIMEFVDGANLRQLERAGRLSSREALQIIPQICDALQYAHDEGVVHRDIKPENVMVDRKGRVRIADFGLAKVVSRDAGAARLTNEGQVMGTPHYMAPEQLERPLAVDHRADIYSLGVVFYEMLTGDLPLGKFSPPSRKVQVDVRLDEVVLRALENDPERRYQQVSEVKSQVETIVGTAAPPVAPPAPAPGSVGPSADRYVRWAGFPVVVERAKGRKLNWNGTLLAFAAVLGSFTVAFGLISAAIGRSLFGWVGVIGWLSLVMRLLISAVIVGFGVRRALDKAQVAAPLPRSRLGRSVHAHPQGRLILGLLATGAVMAVVLHGLMQDPWLEPRFRMWWNRPPGPAVDQQALTDVESGVAVARLPGQGTLKLLAVGGNQPALNGWWRPDGTVITNTLFEIRPRNDVTREGRRVAATIFQVRDLPNGADWVGAEAADQSGSASGGVVLQDNRRLAGATVVQVSAPPAAATTTLRIGLGLEVWRTVGTEDPNHHSSTRRPQDGDPLWMWQIHQIQEVGTNLLVTLVMSDRRPGRESEDRNWQRRIVAVDTHGVVHTHFTGDATPVDESSLWTYTFRGMSRASLREFLLQVRPVHWVEFRNVATEPSSPLPSPRQIGWSAVREVVLTGALDLDDGRVLPLAPLAGEMGSANPVTTPARPDGWVGQQVTGALSIRHQELSALVKDLTRQEKELLGQFTTEHPLVRNLRASLAQERSALAEMERTYRGLIPTDDLIRWMADNRLDVCARPGDLFAWGLMCAPLSPAEFDSITPTEVIRMISAGGYGPRSLKPQKPGEFRATFGFRTQEEGIGVIQVLHIDEGSGGVMLRYKVIEPAAVQSP